MHLKKEGEKEEREQILKVYASTNRKIIKAFLFSDSLNSQYNHTHTSAHTSSRARLTNSVSIATRSPRRGSSSRARGRNERGGRLE